VQASFFFLNFVLAAWTTFHLSGKNENAMTALLAEYTSRLAAGTNKSIVTTIAMANDMSLEEGSLVLNEEIKDTLALKKNGSSTTSRPSTPTSSTRIPDGEFGIQLNRKRNKINIEEEDLTLHIRGVAGLGHRLGRLSGAFHMAKAVNLSHLMVSWGWECGINMNGDPDVFDNLFGKGPLIVKPDATVFPDLSVVRRKRNATKKSMGIINDIPGYMISGVGNKDVNVPALRKHNFYDKLDSDFEFYSQLITLFRFQEQVQDFMRHHEFDKHVIVGFQWRKGRFC
jgi:hypothetical protein